MIKCDNIFFSYGNNCIFQNLSLELCKGELMCVVGLNGCGKTTLLNLISGITKPQKGDIYVDGIKATQYTGLDFSKKVSFLPQNREVPDMNVYDYVLCGRFPYHGVFGSFTETDKNAVLDAMAKVEITHLGERTLKSLSGGERQRANIAMVLAQSTPYMLLDEPITFLDIPHAFEIMNLIVNIKKEGKGIISVVHDMAFALKYADKLLVIDKNSKNYMIATPDVALECGAIDKAFGIKCRAFETDKGREYFFNM